MTRTAGQIVQRLHKIGAPKVPCFNLEIVPNHFQLFLVFGGLSEWSRFQLSAMPMNRPKVLAFACLLLLWNASAQDYEAPGAVGAAYLDQVRNKLKA